MLIYDFFLNCDVLRIDRFIRVKVSTLEILINLITRKALKVSENTADNDIETYIFMINDCEMGGFFPKGFSPPEVVSISKDENQNANCQSGQIRRNYNF